MGRRPKARRNERQPIGVVPDPEGRPCRPCDALLSLQASGGLKLFEVAEAAEEVEGNCHETAQPLFVSVTAGSPELEWQYVQGILHNKQVGAYLHSWLECDGWAIDFSNGRRLIMPATMYRQTTTAEDVKVFTPAEFVQAAKARTLRGVSERK